MLSKYSYVFIIGAGGSNPYGFPLGSELISNIRTKYYINVKNWLRNNDVYSFNSNRFISESEDFTNAISETIGVSIDTYLNINPKFKDKGIHSIIYEIYSAEIQSILPLNPRANTIPNDWYTYLYVKLIQGLNSVDELLNFAQNKIAFITFNYDRSLEHFLFENLYGLLKHNGVQRKELAEEFKKIPFIHVYGKIGHLPWQKDIYDDNGFVYDNSNSILSYGHKKINPFEVGIGFKDMIEVMYESRKEESELKNARDIISNSNRVFFLGFGFDEQNLAILNIPDVIYGKEVYGTAFNCTKNEIIHITKLLKINTSNSKSRIYDYDNLMLLREHLI